MAKFRKTKLSKNNLYNNSFSSLSGLGRSDIPDTNISVTQTDSIIESSQISVVNTPEKNAPTKELDEITAELLGIFQSLDFKKKVKVMNFILKESENIG